MSVIERVDINYVSIDEQGNVHTIPLAQTRINSWDLHKVLFMRGYIDNMHGYRGRYLKGALYRACKSIVREIDDLKLED